MTSNPRNALMRYAKACRRSKISWSIGGLDFCYNEDETAPEDDGSTPGKLMVHLWTLAAAKEVRAGRNALRDAFPRTRKVPRPLKVYEYDGRLQALAYAFKADFYRRIQIPAKVDADGKTKARRNTRIKPLRATQKVDLAVKLDQVGLLGRLIMRGIEFHETVDGVRLKLQKK